MKNVDIIREFARGAERGKCGNLSIIIEYYIFVMIFIGLLVYLEIVDYMLQMGNWKQECRKVIKILNMH